ncbi:MAG: hypothetical protein ACM3KR_06970 [Deltaproteobacteria bacterium]
MSFSLDERNKILRIYNNFINLRQEAYELINEGQGTPELEEQYEKAQEKINEMTDNYINGVPVIPLSRCPFTQEIVNHSIDNLGIDGLWWNNENPQRPEEKLPQTYFAITGALKTAQPIEKFPFLCCPGTEVPYVVPRLLKQPEIKAVIYSLKIGNHTAYPIFYFAESSVSNIERVNDWGTENYSYENEAGDSYWDSYDMLSEDYDFDLSRWIEQGKLFWIKPDDSAMTLMGSVQDCPYIGLDGKKVISYIQDGEIWFNEE